MTAHELLKHIVVEHKLVSYEYFMDKMQDYEINTLINYIPWAQKTSYEQTRLLLWGVLSPYMKHKKKVSDILPLSTDKNEMEQAKEKPMDEKDVEAIRASISKIWGK